MTATEDDYRARIEKAIEDYEEIIRILQGWIDEHTARLNRARERLENLKKERVKA